MNFQRSTFKGAVTVSAPPCKDGHVRFTTVPFYMRNEATKTRAENFRMKYPIVR